MISHLSIISLLTSILLHTAATPWRPGIDAATDVRAQLGRDTLVAQNESAAVASGSTERPQLDQLMGFATLDGGTQGGDPSNVCPVIIPQGTPARESMQRLRQAIACTRRKPGGGVVTFADPTQVITLSRGIELPSNITIHGPVTIESNARRVLRISGQRNIIIRNVVFKTLPGGLNPRGRKCPDPTAPSTVAVGNAQNPGTTGCSSPIEILGTRTRKGMPAAKVRDSSNIWIDHNEFYRCGDKCITIKNGNKDAMGRWSGADNITISNNKFADSFFAILVTVIDNRPGGLRSLLKHSTSECEKVRASGILPQLRVTIYGNLFDHVRRRSARAAYCTSYIHEFNNVIQNYALPTSMFPPGATCRDEGVFGFGPSVTYGARLLLEHNRISAWPDDPRGCKAAVQSGTAANDNNGFVKEQANIYLNGARGGENNPSSVEPVPYSYTLLPSSEVFKFVTENAGASR